VSPIHNPDRMCPAVKPRFCGCGRTGRADPPRREGRGSHAYARLVLLALRVGEERWHEQTGVRVVRTEYPPYWKVERKERAA
jgi:hypothetical protein